MTFFALDYKISSENQTFNSYSYNFSIDAEEQDEELMLTEFVCHDFSLFKQKTDDLTFKAIRKIEEFILLKENWDGFNSVALTKNVAEKAKIFIENIDSNFLKNYEYYISLSPYSTLIIDWYNDRNEFSLEIGKDSIGYFCDGEKVIKEVDKIDISTIESLVNAVKIVEEDLEKTL